MKIVNKYIGIFSFFKLKESIITIVRNEVTGKQTSQIIDSDKKIKTNSLWYYGNYVYDTQNDKIIIYDENLNPLITINKKGINNGNSSLLYIDETTVILYQSIWNSDDTTTSCITYYENLEEKSVGKFCGQILNKKYRLNIKEEEKFSDPTYFRLTNLLDTETYFEYQCEEGYKLVQQFYIWQDTLIFMYYNNIGLILEQRDIKTGKTIWKTHIEDSFFYFDKERGIMASIDGKSGMLDDSTDQYQIINLNSQTVEIGSPLKDFKFTQVESHMATYLHQNKLYFSDNPFSYAGKKPNAPSIGCFDIESKKIDFMQKIPEMAGSSITHIIYNEYKLYVRSTSGNLIVYEI